MPAIHKTIRQSIDLRAGGGEMNWPDALAVKGEKRGHRWEVEVLDGGRPLSWPERRRPALR